MGKYKVTDFDTGAFEIVYRILDSEDPPFIVVIHGPRETGKTKLAKRIINTLYNEYNRVGEYGYEGDIKNIKLQAGKLKRSPDFVLTEGLPINMTASRKFITQNYRKDPNMAVLIAKNLADIDKIRLFGDYEINKNDYDMIIENQYI